MTEPSEGIEGFEARSAPTGLRLKEIIAPPRGLRLGNAPVEAHHLPTAEARVLWARKPVL